MCGHEIEPAIVCTRTELTLRHGVVDLKNGNTPVDLLTQTDSARATSTRVRCRRVPTCGLPETSRTTITCTLERAPTSCVGWRAPGARGAHLQSCILSDVQVGTRRTLPPWAPQTGDLRFYYLHTRHLDMNLLRAEILRTMELNVSRSTCSIRG